MFGAMNRFSVRALAGMTRSLAAVAAGRTPPDLVITGARILSTYTERVLPERELWISGGRIAAVQPTGTCPGKRGCVFTTRGEGSSRRDWWTRISTSKAA